MESAKEKAIWLYYNFYNQLSFDLTDEINDKCAKQCVLIAVELHLEELSKMKLIFSDREIHYKYWEEVRNEIKRL